MFNGSLIEDLFAAVRKAEKSARPALPAETQVPEPKVQALNDFNDRLHDLRLDRLNGRREANSEAE